MIRMLIVGYVFAIRFERALCRDVQVNLAYLWFCGLSIEDRKPDHSVFSRARHERFRDSDIFDPRPQKEMSTKIEAGHLPKITNFCSKICHSRLIGEFAHCRNCLIGKLRNLHRGKCAL